MSGDAALDARLDALALGARADDALLARPLAALRAAAAARPAGLLIAGGDALARRALVARGLAAGRFVHAGNVEGAAAAVAVRRALEEGRGMVVGTAADERRVRPELLRAGRLERVVRVGVAGRAERRDAWAAVLEAVRWKGLDAETGSGGVGALASRLAEVSPGFGLADMRRVVYEVVACAWRPGAAALEAGAEAAAEAEAADVRDLLEAVRRACPTVGGRLDFVTYGDEEDDDQAQPSGDDGRGLWHGIGGYAAVKALLLQLVQWPVAHAAAFARLGVTPPRGILLHGPSGCGKTALASALLRGVPAAAWLRVDGPALFARYLGDSEARVRALFAAARAREPCVVFVDDLEALAGRRDGDGDGGADGGVERRVLGALLSELDGAATSRVFVVACATRLEDVDAALVRRGRIDNVVHVGLPDAGDRADILRVLTARARVDASALDAIAARTAGWTGADLATLVRAAAMRAVRADPKSAAAALDAGHLLAALDELARSAAPKAATLVQTGFR